MTAFVRGIQLYLVALAFVATLTAVWGTNAFLLDSTTAATGWPLMVGISGVLVASGVLLHRRRATSDPDGRHSQDPWSENGW